jgi:hypothetical protein
MSLVALAEYDTAHLNNTPKNVQHVKVRYMNDSAIPIYSSGDLAYVLYYIILYYIIGFTGTNIEWFYKTGRITTPRVV